MSAVIVRTKGKRGTFTLEQGAAANPLLDRAARDFDRMFSKPRSSTQSASTTTTRAGSKEVRDLLARLHRALEQQAAAATAANRRTRGNRAKRYRKALRALGVENPPTRTP